MLGFCRAKFGKYEVGAVNLLRLLGADADAHAAVVLGHVLGDALDAVVPCTAAAHTQPYLAEVYVNLVVHDDDVRELYLIKMRQGLHGLTAQVHERGRLAKIDLGVTYHRRSGHAFKVGLVDPGWELILAGEFVQAGEANVVPCTIVLSADIAEPDDEQRLVHAVGGEIDTGTDLGAFLE